MNRRLILTLVAALTVTASPIAAELAFAQGRGDGRGHGRGRVEDGRGARPERARGGDDGRRHERRGPEPRNPGPRSPEARNYDRREPGQGPRGGYGPPAVRPGGRLPPEYRAPPVADYPRYRLRPPPAGYSWRRAGDAFVLTDRDGRVYDVVPD